MALCVTSRISCCRELQHPLKPGISAPTLAFVDPSRLIRRVYVGRLAIAVAIYVAAVYAWKHADANDTLVASLLMTATLAFTAASATWSEIYGRSLSQTFLLSQSLFDLFAVTAIVQVTGVEASQFTALYILVIAYSSLSLSTTRSLTIAALGCLLYGTVVLLRAPEDVIAIWLQLAIFGAVALSSGYIGARLREARAGTEELVAELRKARLQASDILRNIRSGILTVDARGTLLYANPAASSLLSIKLDDRMGEPILDVLEPVSPVLARALGRAAKEGVRTSRAEGSVNAALRSFPIGLNTTVTTASVTAEPDAEGTATAIFQDISDQKKLDTLHMRAERLEAVAELSASLAHEIKNPLASIRSAVEQLSRSPRTTADEQTLSTLIVRESDRLSRLLSEFLDFARVRVTRIVPVNIAHVARDAAMLAATHPDRQASVEVQTIVPPEPIIVEGDEDLLHRAVFNLALNAVQASPDEGRVSVELAALTSNDAPAGLSFDQGGVAIRVSDTGPGIPESIRDRLFDPFFTTRPGGPGLGLSVVHRAIEAHRGFVFVDSDNRGTRVTVLLPSSQAEAGVTQ